MNKLTHEHTAIDMYLQTKTLSGLSLDAMPYTKDFSNLHVRYVAMSGQTIDIGDFYRALLNLRKKSRLVNRPATRLAPLFNAGSML